MNITILELQYFVEVARQKNFTKAAEILYVTEPTISYHIKKLERKTGTALMMRTTKQVALTSEGERFYQYAKEAVEAYGRLEQVVREFAAPAEKPFRLGITPMVFQFYLRQELEAYKAKYPRETIAFTIEDEDNLLKRLRLQTIDFAILKSYDTNLDMDSTLFDWVLLSKEALCLLCSPEMTGADRDVIPVGEMSQYPFICIKEDGYPADIMKRFQLQNRQNIHYYDGIRTNDVLTIMAVVTAGEAVTCAGASIVGYLQERFGVQALPIDPPIYQYLYFVFPKNKKLSHGEKNLMDALKKGTWGKTNEAKEK